jgi:carbon-monoxide dehydrogenase medium subunit
MKPARFSYRKADSVAEAVAHLQDMGDEAKILAGGQSLIPMMNLRLARPAGLVDINGIRGLAGIELRDDGQLALGALVRHRHLEIYPAPLPGFTLLPRAARFIGHYGVRDRGSVGGSVAHADSTAEWCLVSALFDAEMHVTGPDGPRVIPANDFFEGFLSTALRPDEVLTEVRLTKGASRSAMQEYAQRHGDFAIVVVAAAFDLEGGRCRDPRIVVGGVDGRPVRPPEAERLLKDEVPSMELFQEVADAVAREVRPGSDNYGSAAYRKELARTLTARALQEALGAEPESATEHGTGVAA